MLARVCQEVTPARKGKKSPTLLIRFFLRGFGRRERPSFHSEKRPLEAGGNRKRGAGAPRLFIREGMAILFVHEEGKRLSWIHHISLCVKVLCVHRHNCVHRVYVLSELGTL